MGCAHGPSAFTQDAKMVGAQTQPSASRGVRDDIWIHEVATKRRTSGLVQLAWWIAPRKAGRFSTKLGDSPILATMVERPTLRMMRFVKLSNIRKCHKLCLK